MRSRAYLASSLISSSEHVIARAHVGLHELKVSLKVFPPFHRLLWSTPLIEGPIETVSEVAVVESNATKEVNDETDKLMNSLLQEVMVETAQETNSELVKEEYVEGMDEVLYLEVTDPKKKKTTSCTNQQHSLRRSWDEGADQGVLCPFWC